MKKHQVFKRALACFLVVLMTVTAVPMSGLVGLELPKWSELFATRASAFSEKEYTYKVIDGKATITKVSNSISGDIVIPDTLGNYPVESIGYRAFYNCSNLTSVIIPEGVTSIGVFAFESCIKLSSISIPDSIENIYTKAFDDTSWYENQPYGDVYIGKVYYKYKNLSSKNTSIIIEEGTKCIASGAFDKCNTLEQVLIPSTVKSISNGAFDNCNSLHSINVDLNNISFESEEGVLFNKMKTELIRYPAGKTDKSYSIPSAVKSICSSAFDGCVNIETLTVPDSTTKIGSWAFGNCSKLNKVTIGENVTSIGDYAFKNCENLSALSIPDSVTSIGEYVFSDCKSLSRITISNNMKSIGERAFENCSAITADFKIPDSLESIGEDAFENTPWYNAQQFGDVYAGKVYYKYKGTIPENTNIVIKEQTKGIASSAFRSQDGMINISIPNSVISIGDHAFYGCSRIKNITIPPSVTTIGDYAFSFCDYLSNVTITKGIKYIGVGAFDCCFGLSNVNIENGVERISDRAFFFSPIKSIIIPNSVKFIERSAFQQCRYLTDIVVGNGVEFIEDGAFGGCSRISTIKIGKNVKMIGKNAFNGITSIPEIYYAGSESDWKSISIDQTNDMILRATMHYNVDITHTHSYTSKTTLKATCTENGIKTYTCDCGKTYTETIPATGHKSAKAVKENVIAATCTANGSYDSVIYCSVCKIEISRSKKTIVKTDHTNKTTTNKATTTKDGKTVTACTVCGKVSKTTPIYKASSIKLSATSYTYNGKVQKPTVTVKNSKGTTLNNGTDYTLTYAPGRKTPGKYSVTVNLKGVYSGSKTLYFTILPGRTSKLTASQTTSSIKATWKAVTGADGYKVTLYTSSGKAVKTVYTTKTSTEFTKLSKGTTYKVRVTAYKTIDGKKVYSSVYTQLTTATKPGTPTLKATAGSKKADLSWTKQTGATGYVVYMATSRNGKYSKIATLKGNTKVSYTKTGLTKGKTYYFKVAAYTVANGKTLYSGYSSVKAVKIK